MGYVLIKPKMGCESQIIRANQKKFYQGEKKKKKNRNGPKGKGNRVAT